MSVGSILKRTGLTSPRRKSPWRVFKLTFALSLWDSWAPKLVISSASSSSSFPTQFTVSLDALYFNAIVSILSWLTISQLLSLHVFNPLKLFISLLEPLSIASTLPSILSLRLICKLLEWKTSTRNKKKNRKLNWEISQKEYQPQEPPTLAIGMSEWLVPLKNIML